MWQGTAPSNIDKIKTSQTKVLRITAKAGLFITISRTWHRKNSRLHIKALSNHSFFNSLNDPPGTNYFTTWECITLPLSKSKTVFLSTNSLLELPTLPNKNRISTTISRIININLFFFRNPLQYFAVTPLHPK